MKIVLNKRLKMIIGVVAIILVLGSGTLFGLAKTGVISLGSFADELVGTKSRAGQVIVQLVDDSGAAAAQAGVEFNLSNVVEQTPAPALSYNQKSDSMGRAIFSDISSVYKWRISWIYPGCAPQIESVAVRLGVVTEVQMKRYCAPVDDTASIYNLTGTIADSSSKQPIEHVKVSAPNGSSVETDSKGYYALNKLPFIPEPISSHVFIFSASGYITQTLSLSAFSAGNTTPGGTISNANVQLVKRPVENTARLHGSVESSAYDTPLGGVTITVYSDTPSFNCEASATTEAKWLTDTWPNDKNQKANFVIDVPGRCLGAELVIKYTLSGYFNESQRYKPSDPYRIPTMKLYRSDEAAAKISGNLYGIRADGKKVPIKGRVLVLKTDGKTEIRSIETDKDGFYNLNLTMAEITANPTIILKGLYEIKDNAGKVILTLSGVYDNGLNNQNPKGSIALTKGMVKTGTDISILLSQVPDGKTVITGHIYDKATNNPIEGAYVSLVKNGKYLGATPGKTDASGYYQMVLSLDFAINAVDYTLVASKTNYSDDAEARKGVRLMNGRIYQINFKLNKCN